MTAEELGNFDALAWIDRHFAERARLDYDQLRLVLCFSLIWNLFETVACRRKAPSRRHFCSPKPRKMPRTPMVLGLALECAVPPARAASPFSLL